MATITMNEIIHAAVRRDLARMEGALRSFPDGDGQRAADLTRAWEFLAHMLHEHHVSEDTVLWPYLRSLGGIDPTLMDQMEGEHVEMAAALDRATEAMRELAASPTAEAAAAAAHRLSEATSVTTRHLEHEETAVTPLVAAQMGTPEWKAVEKGFRKAAMPDAGRFFAWLQDGMDPQFRSALSGAVPAPVRWGLVTVKGRGYHREIAPVWR